MYLCRFNSYSRIFHVSYEVGEVTGLRRYHRNRKLRGDCCCHPICCLRRNVSEKIYSRKSCHYITWTTTVLLCSYYSTVPVFFYERGGNIHLMIIIQYLSYHILRFEVPSNALLVYISTLSSALHMYGCKYVWSSHIAEYGSAG